jgi:hypothetical protein
MYIETDDPKFPIDPFTRTRFLDLDLKLPESFGLPIAGGKPFDRATSCLLANLVALERSLPSGFLALSRSPGEYKKSRYNQNGVGYRSLIENVIPRLEDIDFIKLGKIGFSDRRGNKNNELSKNQMKRSRYKTGLGFKAWIEAQGHIETIISKPELIILKNSNKKVTDYHDTAETRRMRAFLQRYNDFLKGADVRLPRRMVHGELVSYDRNQLHRVFNGNFQHGGRFYGHFVQELPSETRGELLIDGEEVQELDYGSMHLHLLYSLEGASWDAEDGDPYYVEGYQRDEVKALFTKGLNVKNYRGLIRALNEDYPHLKSTHAKGLFGGFCAKHRIINHYFYTKCATQLQHMDSQIMERILEKLLENNILGIPIHDGVLFPKSCTDQVRAIMEECYISFDHASAPDVKEQF